MVSCNSDIANKAAYALLNGRRVDSVIAGLANDYNISTLDVVRLIKGQFPTLYEDFAKDLERIEAEGPDFPLPEERFRTEYYRYRAKELQLRLLECRAKLAAATNIIKEFEAANNKKNNFQ